ncbi:MAG: hypothetical protein NT178_10440 [Proteobacteria bacterium]|nr:hypothetical protein [Pseudomonadota bacterium]
MAAQIFYVFLINDDRYVLIGKTGDDLVSSEQLGVRQPDLHVSYHRNLCAIYELTPETLYFRGIIPIGENENYKSIGGTVSAKSSCQANSHDRNEAIPFNGKIRLARGFIKEPYINMGYQKALAFRTVLDITLKDGQVVKVKNRSQEMEQKRDALKECYNSANIREYRKSLNKLEKILYKFSFDINLQ